MLLSWNVTKRCNLKCKHCYRDAGSADPLELDTAEGKALLDEIALAGFKIVILSGGEPLMRSDIYELISYAASRKLRPVLGSNGTFISAEVAAGLKKSGLARAGVSLDSVDADIHDEFRQEKGSWERTVEAMEHLKCAGLDFQVHTTVTRWNYTGIEQLIDFSYLRGAKAHHIFFLIPTGRGKEINTSMITQQDYLKVLRKILLKQENMPMELKPVCAPQFIPLSQGMHVDMRFQRGCLAGINYCCILPNGDVHPCPYLALKIGNVRTEKFSYLWANNPVFQQLRTQGYSGSCAGCRHKFSCGGCRARAWHTQGDFMGEDPECFFSPGAIKNDFAKR